MKEFIALIDILKDPQHPEHKKRRDEILTKSYLFIRAVADTENKYNVLMQSLTKSIENFEEKIQKYFLESGIASGENGLICFLLDYSYASKRTSELNIKDKRLTLAKSLSTFADSSSSSVISQDRKAQKNTILPEALLKKGRFLIKKTKKGDLKYENLYKIATAFHHTNVDWEEKKHQFLKKVCSKTNPAKWANIPELIKENFMELEKNLHKLKTKANNAMDALGIILAKKHSLLTTYKNRFHKNYLPNEMFTDSKELQYQKIFKELNENKEKYEKRKIKYDNEAFYKSNNFERRPITQPQLIDIYDFHPNSVSQFVARHDEKSNSFFEFLNIEEAPVW